MIVSQDDEKKIGKIYIHLLTIILKNLNIIKKINIYLKIKIYK